MEPHIQVFTLRTSESGMTSPNTPRAELVGRTRRMLKFIGLSLLAPFVIIGFCILYPSKFWAEAKKEWRDWRS